MFILSTVRCEIPRVLQYTQESGLNTLQFQAVMGIPIRGGGIQPLLIFVERIPL